VSITYPLHQGISERSWKIISAFRCKAILPFYPNV
jgi:hypothetical protein